MDDVNFVISDRVITYENKIPLIGYNSDCIARFKFDNEWDGTIKTARFVQNGKYTDIILDKDDMCMIPPLINGMVKIGAFNDTMTTTYIETRVGESIKDGSGNPIEPTPDVYSQIIKMIKDGMLKGDPGYTPKKGEDYFTDNEISEFKDVVTPKKGIDYTDGYTPIKNTDYFDGEDGKSAYQIAIENGFVGTEEEWLESLNGKDGKTPVKGVDYTDGIDGKSAYELAVEEGFIGTKEEWLESLNGQDGYTPQKGVDYFDGEPGYTPQKGTDYYTEEDKAEMLASVKSAFEPDVQAINQTAEQAMSIAKGRATAYIYNTVEELEAALADEEFVASLVVGDNFYIRALEVPDYWWDGESKQELETEKPDLSGLVKDVTVNGKSVVTDGVANIPVASDNTYGVGKIRKNYGVYIINDCFRLTPLQTSDIDSRSGAWNDCAITLAILDYAVRDSLCYNRITYTDSNKAAARTLFGAVSADEVTAMINEALGVIENGSY